MGFFSHSPFFFFFFSRSLLNIVVLFLPRFFTTLTLVCESPEQGSDTVNWKNMVYPSVDHIKCNRA